MNKILAIAAFLFVVQFGLAQKPATVFGEVLVQLKPGVTPNQIEKAVEEELGILPSFKLTSSVSDYMGVWLFSFDEHAISKADMLRTLSTISGVSIAQANHIIEDRIVPDDPFFGQQWHHFQANDHDIDSDLAWEITTGGVTASGDTIVVCIVETGGAKWDVPDLIDNHWVNIHEIPGNGIDDDGNGYIDDYHGWNIVGQNDQVIGTSSHGTQVSSMVGSTGNNATGVTGVNWNVKLMQVRMGGVSEANVIAAYTYPLIMRKLYNETGGERGAFVVVTNSSWGTNYGQPADAPLWCAMYDSLGVYGILSAGATANINVNVDEMGDLPTACPSDYLVTVTNTNSSDVKVSSSGYGLATIDLGAPGNQVYLANNNGYGNATGTSFSTPCVSGAIALLYSAPCTSFMGLVNSDPAVAALQMKSYILNGVDQTELLQTQTLSGGRLNVYNGLLQMLEQCGSCMSPMSPFVTQEPNTLNYTLQWASMSSVEEVELRYRIQGESVWTEVTNIEGNTYVLSSLAACSTYEYQLRSLCAGEESEWTEVFSFETDGCCMHPDYVLISSIEDTSAFVVWLPVMAANGYTVIVTSESGVVNTFNSVDPVLYMDFLEPCTHYEVIVLSNCEGDMPEPILKSFITTGCGPCTDLEYCYAAGGNNTEFIQRVVLGDIDHVSGAGTGYNFITDATTELEIGGSYTIQCYAGFPQQPYNQNFRVWIDYNGDGEFQHPDEMAFDAAAPTNSMASGTITIPFTATEGTVRMRVAMRYAQFTNTEPNPCGTWTYGEVEDYCVTLVAPIVGVNESAMKTWRVYPNPAHDMVYIEQSGGAVQQVIIYDQQGRLVLQQDNVTGNSVSIESLQPGVYSLMLRSGDEVQITGIIKF